MTQPVKILFELQGNPMNGESVWAERVSENLYRLMNIPFYAMGYAEGDVVHCNKQDEWNKVISIAEDSGNGTVRVMFDDSKGSAAQEVLEELVSVGCTYECADSRLVAITIPSTLDVPFSQMVNYLNSLPDNLLVGWEIAKRPANSE